VRGSRGSGLVKGDEPATWSEVRVYPVLEVRAVVEYGLLLMNDYTRVVAFGPRGEAWRVAPEIVTDMLVMDRVVGGRLRVHGQNYAHGPVETVLDLSTGERL